MKIIIKPNVEPTMAEGSECHHCDGTGVVLVNDGDDGHGNDYTDELECNHCNGTGREKVK